MYITLLYAPTKKSKKSKLNLKCNFLGTDVGPKNSKEKV